MFVKQKDMILKASIKFVLTRCQGNRECCQMCQVKFHKDHIDELIDKDQIINYIKTQSKKQDIQSPQVNQKLVQLIQVQKYLDELQMLVQQEFERINTQTVSIFCEDIGNKYHILGDQFIGLENYEWNLLVEDMLIGFQVQNLEIVIKELLINKLDQEFQGFINQFQQTINKIEYKLNQIVKQKEKKINFENFQKDKILTLHYSNVNAIDICKNRNLLASGSSNGTLNLWNLVDNSLIKTYKSSEWVQDVVFSNKGNFLTFGGQGLVQLIGIKDLKKDFNIIKFKGHQSCINRLLFSNDSNYLISGSEDKTIRIWDIIEKKQAFQLNSESQVNGIAISNDDKLIAQNSSDGKIKIWNFLNRKLLCSVYGHSVGLGIEFSSNQEMLVSSGRDSKIKLWRLQKLNRNQLLLTKKFKITTTDMYIWTVLFSPCSRFIISFCNDDRQMKVIDFQTGDVVKVFKTQTTNTTPNHCVKAAISEDMEIMACPEEYNVLVWRKI